MTMNIKSGVKNLEDGSSASHRNVS